MEKIKIVELPLAKDIPIINKGNPWLITGSSSSDLDFILKPLEKKKIPCVLFLNEKLDLKSKSIKAIVLNTDWSSEILDYLTCWAISSGIYIFYMGNIEKYKEVEFFGYSLPEEGLTEKNLDFILKILKEEPLRKSYIRETYKPQLDLFKNLSLNLKDSLSHTFELPRFNFMAVFKFREDIVFERKPVKTKTLGEFRDENNLLHVHLLFETPTNNKAATPRILPKEGLCIYFRIIDGYSKNSPSEEAVVSKLQKTLMGFLSRQDLNFKIRDNDLYINDFKIFGGMTFSDGYCKSGTIGCFYIYTDFEKEKELFNKICKDTRHTYGGLNFYEKNLNPDNLALFIIENITSEEFNDE